MTEFVSEFVSESVSQVLFSESDEARGEKGGMLRVQTLLGEWVDYIVIE